MILPALAALLLAAVSAAPIAIFVLATLAAGRARGPEPAPVVSPSPPAAPGDRQPRQHARQLAIACDDVDEVYIELPAAAGDIEVLRVTGGPDARAILIH